MDASYVYWTNGGTADAGGGIMRCAISGCDNNPTTLASGQGSPMGIVVDSTNIYWIGNGPGMRNPSSSIRRR